MKKQNPKTPPYGLPPTAKRVFNGHIWNVYQWEQRMFDGTTGTFECLKRVNTTVIIPVIGDKILIQRQLQPHWDRELICLPSGRCNGEEEPLKCGARELLEETGYASNDWEFLQSVHPYRNIVWEVFTFIARDCQKQAQQNLDPGERINLEMVSFAELLNLVEHPDWRDLGTATLMYQCRLYPEKRRALEEKLFNKTLITN